jgi:hypothetical protein
MQRPAKTYTSNRAGVQFPVYPPKILMRAWRNSNVSGFQPGVLGAAPSVRTIFCSHRLWVRLSGFHPDEPSSSLGGSANTAGSFSDRTQAFEACCGGLIPPPASTLFFRRRTSPHKAGRHDGHVQERPICCLCSMAMSTPTFSLVLGKL